MHVNRFRRWHVHAECYMVEASSLCGRYPLGKSAALPRRLELAASVSTPADSTIAPSQELPVMVDEGGTHHAVRAGAGHRRTPRPGMVLDPNLPAGWGPDTPATV